MANSILYVQNEMKYGIDVVHSLPHLVEIMLVKQFKSLKKDVVFFFFSRFFFSPRKYWKVAWLKEDSSFFFCWVGKGSGRFGAAYIIVYMGWK